jgi:RNA polymerase sigma-70 factor (ECF subfamily)
MSHSDPKTLRSGSLPDSDRTRWLLKHEAWLRLIARHEVNQRFAAKFDPSDVVQQTLMEAWQDWDQLTATDPAQRLAWLRKILAHQLAHHVRHFDGTQKRSLTREVSIERSLIQSTMRLDAMVPARDPSPSAAAASLEQQARLAEVLERLPEDYRQVILLRNIEELSHDEVAQQMGRSPAAARMLWLRAIEALSRELGGSE